MRITSIISVLLSAGMFCSPASAIPVLELVPRQAELSLGADVEIDVVVSGLEAESPGEIVSAFDLFVDYDPMLLAPMAIEFGNLLGGPFDSFQDPFLPGSLGLFSMPGIVNFSELSLLFDDVLGALQPDSFTLATLTFATLDIGLSALGFAPHPFLGVAADVKGRDAAILPLDLAGALVAVLARPVRVPEPPTLALLGAGLLLLCRRCRIAPRG
jgi:hypothetical protein